MRDAEACPQEGRKVYQHLAAFAASLAGMNMGLALGWTSAAAKMQFELNLSDDQWSWVGSMMAVGAILGSLPLGTLLGRWGRRAVLLMLGPLSLCAWALHYWATSAWMLYLGRALLGASVGGGAVAVPVFAGEVAESSVRGHIGTYFELLLCFGILFIFLMGYGLSTAHMNAVCMVVPALMFAAVIWFPDTPRWLLLRGRREDCRRALVFYRGPKYDVDAEMRGLEAGTKSRKPVSGLAAFNTRAARRGLIYATGLFVIQQFTGINATTFNASQMFMEAGVPLDPQLSTVVLPVAELPAMLVSVLLVDRLGRRALLHASSVSMLICHLLLGAYFYYKEDLKHVGWLPLLFVTTMHFMFVVGYGCVPYLIVGEVFPDEIKGIASAITNIVNWICVFLVTKLYYVMSENLGLHTTFWIYGAVALLAVFFVMAMPETKGRTLDEIQADLEGKNTKNCHS